MEPLSKRDKLCKIKNLLKEGRDAEEVTALLLRE
jgi:hypothetical protein